MRKNRGSLVFLFMVVVIFACAGPAAIAAPTPISSSQIVSTVAPQLVGGIPVYNLPRGDSDDPRKRGTIAIPSAGYEIGFPNNWIVVSATRNDLENAYLKYKEQSPELADQITGFAYIAFNETSSGQQALFAFDSSPERLANGKTVVLYIGQFTEPKRIATPLTDYVRIFLNDTASQLDVQNVILVFSDTGVPIAVIQSKVRQQNSSGQTVYVTHFIVNTGKAYLEIVIRTFDPSFDVLKDLRLTLRSINYIKLMQPGPTTP